MRTKKMGKKTEKAQGKVAAAGKKPLKETKEPQLPAPKYGPTDQKAPPPPGVTWAHSRMRERAIQELEAAKLLQSKELINWRCAWSDAWQWEEYPGETVMWAHFIERGLTVPASRFFLSVDYYRIQVIHLNPNGVLHLSIFVHLCEAYLKIPPRLELFRRLFRCKPQPSALRTEVLGGAGIQLRNAASYLEYELPDSHGDWKAKWFYVRNHPPALPPVTHYAPKHGDFWVEEPEESTQVEAWVARIAELKAAGLTVINVAASFLKRRVQPLQNRDRLGFDYIGFDDDPSRMSVEDVSDDDVETLLGKLFKNFRGVPEVPEEIQQVDAWYAPRKSRVLTGYPIEPPEEEEKAPPPALKRQKVVRKSTHEATSSGIGGSKAADVTYGDEEATSIEVVTIAQDAAAAVEVEDEAPAVVELREYCSSGC
ncbi:uncharacterized protein [Miscanthus floridulus]|uniref:uncharacterized protein isoform X2 n=1 Tax=Miscanthus floridulus TaxID=154761 RepID=UPI003458CA4B